MAVASWTLLAENDCPSARAGHAAAFANNQVLWIFGGKDEAVLSDIWLFHEAAKAWTSSTIAEVFSAAPSARKEHVAVTDGNGDLWIHGGQDDTVCFNDLWKLSTNRWTLVSNGSVPTRSSHVGVWDSLNGALWIHGGFDGVLRQDIWKFEAERGRWFSITDDYNRPSARAHHVAALDALNGVIWIHGGYDESLLGDLWKFDTRTYAWNLISTGGPSARAHHVAVWDTLNQALWIHGGFDGMACQDMWRFEQLTSTWNTVAQSGPSARYDHVAAWDGIHSMILVHGGYDQGFRRDLWKFEVPLVTSTSTETKTSMTSSQTTTSMTRSTTSTSTASIPPAFGTATEELPSDVLALILALSVLGVALCLVAFYWYRKRQKSRAVVPVPPPLPPPLPPHEPPPPSPGSPQLRVNMQVLVPPPSPQQPPPKPEQSRTAAFSAYVPLSIPEPHQLPICAPKCCAPNAPPLDQVEVLKLQAAKSCASCRPRAPGRTERAADLPNLPGDLPGDLPRSERSQICGSPREVSTIGRDIAIASQARPLPVQGIQCKVCGKCRKV